MVSLFRLSCKRPHQFNFLFHLQISDEQEMKNGVAQAVKFDLVLTILRLLFRTIETFMPPFVHVGRLQHLSTDT